MSKEQLKLEVNHILDSGANEVRFVELIERLLKKEAIGFAEWVHENCTRSEDDKGYTDNYKYHPTGKLYTTEQLYQLYLQSLK